MRDLPQRVRTYLVHNVLHLDDTPQRIALGVALGFFVAFTPTLGLQMILYWLLVAVMPVNKISGMAPLWITNPATALPIFYSNWRVGHALLHEPNDPQRAKEIEVALTTIERIGSDWERFAEASFWRELGSAASALGVELWVGSLFVATVLAGVGYLLTLRFTVAHRARKAAEAATQLS